MYYSYIEIEYVATSFSPARTDLALKLLNRQQVPIRKGRRRSTLHPKCVFRLAAPVVCKLCMVPTMENAQT